MLCVIFSFELHKTSRQETFLTKGINGNGFIRVLGGFRIVLRGLRGSLASGAPLTWNQTRNYYQVSSEVSSHLQQVRAGLIGIVGFTTSLVKAFEKS